MEKIDVEWHEQGLFLECFSQRVREDLRTPEPAESFNHPRHAGAGKGREGTRRRIGCSGEVRRAVAPVTARIKILKVLSAPLYPLWFASAWQNSKRPEFPP